MNTQQINLEIDEIRQNSDIIISGWGYDKNSLDQLKYNVIDGDIAVESKKRIDVANALGLNKETDYGFEVTIKNHKGKTVDLVVIDSLGNEYTEIININKVKRIAVKRKIKSALNLGIVGLVKRLTKTSDYKKWIKKNENLNPEKIKKEIQNFVIQPKISLVTPVYNVEEKWFAKFIESLQNQFYTNWEVCLADDASPSPHVKPMLEKFANADERIKVVYREQNGHISAATNSAIEIATGDYVGFIDNDDTLAPFALYEVVKAINEDEKRDFFYSDEDKLTIGGERIDPFFKPNWNSELLHGHNYITHFVVMKKSLLDEVGMLNGDYNGAQDYDFVLRSTTAAKKIHHIEAISYHWRMIETSTASDPYAKMYAFEAGRKALEDDFKRRNVEAEIEMHPTNLGTYTVEYPIDKSKKVTVVFTGTGNTDKWTSIFEDTNFEIGTLENSNYDYILFLNQELTPENDDKKWLNELLSNIERSEIGLVTGSIKNKHGQYINVGLSIDYKNKKLIFDDYGVSTVGIGTYFRPTLPRFIGAATLDLAIAERADVIAYGSEDGVKLSLSIRSQTNKEILFTPYAAMISEGDNPPLEADLNEYQTQAQVDPYINLSK
jgi:glycosyltransferase involved in cell wall biosynthesis